ncbi:MAG: hypothetical protein HY717_09715 [Planctomycetes bacterium]|nr:hypothetical protein [Planctomycetota bacterium]
MEASGNRIAGLTGTPSPAAKSLAGRAQLTRDEFYQIMIAELSHQDPFEPMDNQKFLEQLASLQTLDVTGRLGDGIDKLLFQQRLSAASVLIGKQVMAADENGGTLSGRVERVRVQGQNIDLLLDSGKQVSFEKVLEIKQ